MSIHTICWWRHREQCSSMKRLILPKAKPLMRMKTRPNLPPPPNPATLHICISVRYCEECWATVIKPEKEGKKHDQSTECEWRWREVTCSADVQVPTLHYSHKSCEKYKQWSPGVYQGCPGVFNQVRAWSIWVILGIWWKGLPQHHWCSHTDQKIHDVSRTGQYINIMIWD